jgi:hypothetical protein
MTRPLKILLFIFLMTVGLLAQQKIGICITNEKLYENKQVQEFVLKNCNGIVFAGNQEGFKFWLANRDVLNHSMTLNGWAKDKYPELIPYIDECLNTPTPDNANWKEIRDKYPGTIIGEIPPSNFEQVDNGIVHFVYTSYSSFWFRLCTNFYVPFSDQRGSVEKLIKRYSGRVPFIWISTSQANNFSTLIQFARENGLSIMLYCESGTADEVVNYGNQFVSELNK